MSRRRRNKRRKSTIVNKTRFTLFSMFLIIVLASIFIKVFLPNMSPKAVDDTERLVRVDSEKIYSEKETEPETSEKDIATETEVELTEEISEAEVLTETEELTESSRSQIEMGSSNFNFNLSSVAGPLVYYSQEDSTWADELYGPYDAIWSHGCGPAVMATIVTSLTDYDHNPKTMSDWAYQNGYCAVGNGSLHSMIPETARAFGLNAEGLYHADAQTLKKNLEEGKIIVMVSGHGGFSDSDGHFIIIRDLKPNGRVTVSDSVQTDHVYMEWELEDIVKEQSGVSASGGPFWAIWK